MSPNEQKITSGRDGDGDALSMISIGVTHTGQPGPWISVISRGSISSRAEADDRVRLAAADLHDVPRPRRRRGGWRRPALDGVGVAVFVDVFHGSASGSSAVPAAGSGWLTSSCNSANLAPICSM